MLAERLVFHPLRNAAGLHDMIAAIGMLLFLEAGAQAIWGADFHRMQSPYGGMVEIFASDHRAAPADHRRRRGADGWCCTCS
jgi:branched-subunit amino acid ABC-type transport system permease component